MERMGDHLHKLNHNGYHFNYIFDKPLGQLAAVIDVLDPWSGRTLQVYVSTIRGASRADLIIGRGSGYSRNPGPGWAGSLWLLLRSMGRQRASRQESEVVSDNTK